MKKVCLVGCGTIGRLHAKNLVGKVELSFHSRTPGQRRGPQPPMRRWADLRIVRRRPRQRSGCGANQLAARCPSAAGRLRIGSRQGSAGGKTVVRHRRRFSGDWRGISSPSRRNCDDRGNYYYKPSLKLLKWIIQQDFIGQVQQATLGKCFTQQATGWKSSYGALLEGGIHFVALGADLFAEAPQRVTAEFPDTKRRPGAEFNSSGRIPIGGRAGVALRLERLQLDQGHLSARADFGGRRAGSFSSAMGYTCGAGAAEAALLSGVGDLMGYKGMMRDFLQCLQEPDGSRIRTWRGLSAT